MKDNPKKDSAESKKTSDSETETEFVSFQNRFLIAMPTLLDPVFFRAVTYICEHTESGAMGLVINQPLSITLGDIFEQMGIECNLPDVQKQIVFGGGPIRTERGFILHSATTSWESTIIISNDVAITTSRDILVALSKNEGPKDALVALGYASWTSKQLEIEIGANSWLYGPASSEILFHTPIENRWRKAAQLAGVDIDRVSNDVGHA